MKMSNLLSHYKRFSTYCDKDYYFVKYKYYKDGYDDVILDCLNSRICYTCASLAHVIINQDDFEWFDLESEV